MHRDTIERRTFGNKVGPNVVPALRGVYTEVMLSVAAEIPVGEGLAFGLIAAVFLAGLKHGFDIDHVAAISDITSSQTSRKRSLTLATSYALGHMLVLFVLGVVAVLVGERLSNRIDSVAGRVIGLTLVMLGIYVFYSLVRYRRDFRMQSRWMLVIAGVRRLIDRLRPSGPLVVVEHEHEHHHEGPHDHPHVETRSTQELGSGTIVAPLTTAHTHRHTHVASMPSDPFTEYGIKTSFLVGMVHGVGAETPTQVLLFTSAAGMAGAFGGLVLVALFVSGLLLGNSILAVIATVGFATGKKVPLLYMGAAAATAAVSIYVGVAYMLDRPQMLPAVLGG